MAIWERIVADIFIIVVFGAGIVACFKWATNNGTSKSEKDED